MLELDAEKVKQRGSIDKRRGSLVQEDDEIYWRKVLHLQWLAGILVYIGAIWFAVPGVRIDRNPWLLGPLLFFGLVVSYAFFRRLGAVIYRK